MTEFTSFALADGLQVTVAAPTPAGLGPAGLRPKAAKAEQSLRQALRPVTAAAAEVIEGFREIPGRPDEIEISFGVKLDGTFGAVIATAAVGTHLEVTLRWTRPQPADPQPADGGGGDELGPPPVAQPEPIDQSRPAE
jgi:Trypsin-co-occurring domain 1